MERTRGIEKIARDEEDRLSTLPDGVLCHILSFLDTKYAVQTCVLSKRFANLWSLLPVLNFDSVNCKGLRFFSNFVNRILSLRDDLDKVKDLKFIHRRNVKPQFLEKVINYAVLHGVARLQIYVENNGHGPHSFPESGYSSESLRTFKLNSNGFFAQEKPFSFPELRTLHLERVSLVHSNLFSGCPCLRELTLIDCSTRQLDTWNIDAPQLTKLTIESVCYCPILCKVVVSAPRLVSFCYKSSRPLLLSTGELSDLEVVDVELYQYPSFTKQMTAEVIKKKVALNLVKMLKLFHNAKSVTLSLGTIKVLSVDPCLLAPERCPFDNVKSLKFKASQDDSTFVIPFNMMTYLLNRSPHAEVSMKFPRFCKRCVQTERCKDCLEKQHFPRNSPFPE